MGRTSETFNSGESSLAPLADMAAVDAAPVRPQSTGPNATPLADGHPEVMTVAEDDQAGKETFCPLVAEGNFGSFKFVHEIARGGMGVVWLALEVGLDRYVAVKTIREDRLNSGKDPSNRFLLEARATAQLRHANIVPVYAFGMHEGKLFLAMQFLSGGSLSRQVTRLCQEEPTVAVCLVEKVTRAVEFAHSRNVMHRDIKPANILLDEVGEPYISDFGLAKPLDTPSELTDPGDSVPGTPAYMSPEQAAGRATEVGPTTDVWALGVVLFELLTGQRPFPGKLSHEVLNQIKFSEPISLRSLRPAIDGSLEAIILRCLRKDPKARYASAGALADDLRRWQLGEPTIACPEGWIARKARSVRPYAAYIAAAVITAILLGLFGLRSGADVGRNSHEPPESRLIAINNRLASHQRTALLGDDGLPVWFHQLLGNISLQQYPVAPGTLHLSTWERGLVELLPAPPASSFRFETEIHPDGMTATGESGIYFGCSPRETPRGPEYWFAQLTLGDIKGNRLSFKYHRYQPETVTQRSENYEKQVRTKILPVPPASEGIVYHQLAVEVTPGKVSVFCDRDLLTEIREEDFWQTNKSLLYPNTVYGPDFPEWFTPRGGLGLYECTANSLYRKTEVIPLTP
jgi:serine/threonine protein kinase